MDLAGIEIPGFRSIFAVKIPENNAARIARIATRGTAPQPINLQLLFHSTSQTGFY